MILATLALAAALSTAGPDAGFVSEARTVCAAAPGVQPSLQDVEIEAVPAIGEDLPGLKVRHVASGAWMYAYYDAVSEAAAKARSACLGAQLGLLHEITGDDRPDGQFDSVVFTSRPVAVRPGDTGRSRWVVETRNGALTPGGETMLLVTVPHEQGHAFQHRSGSHAPRWFEEGHAEWVGRQVSEVISPDEALRDAQASAAALAASTEGVALGHWGGLGVTRDAVRRQATPEDQRRMDADPGFRPRGPFRFNPADMTSDESNTTARYDAAWRVFRDMTAARSAEAVRLWVKALTVAPGELAPATVIETARTELGFDLAPRLQ